MLGVFYSKKADKVSVQLELTLGGETKINKIVNAYTYGYAYYVR